MLPYANDLRLSAYLLYQYQMELPYATLQCMTGLPTCPHHITNSSTHSVILAVISDFDNPKFLIYLMISMKSKRLSLSSVFAMKHCE